MRIETLCAQKDTVRFVLIGDTQRNYDDTQDFVNALNQRNDVCFVIHGGDISDFGLTKEFLWMRDILSQLHVPYVAVLGNHDCLATGLDVYRKLFGNENFVFMAGSVKFICINTNSMEFKFSPMVPDFDFIEKLQAENDPQHEKTVFVMHAPPLDDQLTSEKSEQLHQKIKLFRKVQFCLHAHHHSIEVNDLFADGVIYYGCGTIGSRTYLLFTITPDNYTYEVVSF